MNGSLLSDKLYGSVELMCCLVSNIQILDATNNEPSGPHGAHLAEIAQATHN